LHEKRTSSLAHRFKTWKIGREDIANRTGPWPIRLKKNAS